MWISKFAKLCKGILASLLFYSFFHKRIRSYALHPPGCGGMPAGKGPAGIVL